MSFKLSFTTQAVAAISLCLIGGTTPAAADIRHVPGDYPTIQEGIDAAVDGDEVVVADGTWTGVGNTNLDFGGRLITVRSDSGDPALCIIDCEWVFEVRGFHFHSGETDQAVVSGERMTPWLRAR